jgi:hypothetical protein
MWSDPLPSGRELSKACIISVREAAIVHVAKELENPSGARGLDRGPAGLSRRRQFASSLFFETDLMQN